MGGWSQTGGTRELHYIDPSVGPTDGAYALMGWLLAGSFEAGHGAWRAAPGATDAADVGEPVGEA